MQETYAEGKIITDKQFKKLTIEHCRFIDCDFKNCRMEECSILGCAFVNCRFYNCTILTLSSKYSEVKNASFETCNLIGVHWDELLPSGRYAHSIDKLENCHMKYNTFAEMTFTKFDFSSNSIQESIFEQCSLSGSSFQGCRLDGTQFYRCDMRKADFREAMGYRIDVLSNKVANAKFSFPEAIRLLDSLQIKID